MLIRLTLATTAAIIGGMMYFGNDDGNAPVGDVAETVLTPAPVRAAAPEPAAATLVQTAPVQAEVLAAAETPEPEPRESDADVEVTRQGSLEVTAVLPASMQVDAVVSAALEETPDAPLQPVAAAQPEPRIVYVTGSRVNLRAGPSTGDAVVGRLVRGTAAEVLGEADDGWLQIREVATGTEGFMSGDFLSADDPG